MGAGQLLEHRPQQQLLQQQQEPVIEAPEEEGPPGPVPDAGEHPDDHQVPGQLDLGAAAAAQGNIDVVPEPGAEGDVPAPPELGDAPGDIGVIEIDHKVKAQHGPQAPGHIGVAAEVEVRSAGRRPECRTQAARVPAAAGSGGGLVPQQGELVGQQNLFGQTDGELLDAPGKSGPRCSSARGAAGPRRCSGRWGRQSAGGTGRYRRRSPQSAGWPGQSSR